MEKKVVIIGARAAAPLVAAEAEAAGQPVARDRHGRAGPWQVSVAA